MTQTTDSAHAVQPPPGGPGRPSRLDAILEGACRVISRDGAHGLHMQAVAREAGVSKALVHYYVSTRSELLRKALAYADAKTRATLEQELAPLEHGRARLERMLVDYASNAPAMSDSQALWNVAWGSLKLDDDLAPAVRAGYARWFDWISTLVEEGRTDGSIVDPRDTRTLAIELNALADGLWSLVDTDVVTRAEATDLVRSVVGMLAPGQAA